MTPVADGLPKKVLVIDDDPDNRTVIRTLLEQHGCEVASADDAARGRRMIVEERPDLVLLDVVLPDTLGTELCADLKSDDTTSETLVILVSGNRISPEEQAHGLDVGADDYISRPFDAVEFIARVRALVRLRDSLVRRYPSERPTFGGNPPVGETARILDQQRLRDGYPAEFAEFVERYAAVLSEAIKNAGRRPGDRATERIRDMVSDLAFLRASARDILDIHTMALTGVAPLASARRAAVVREESRVLLLELMGYLMNDYRLRS